MRLKFETNFGYRFELDVSRNATLEEIKVKINSLYGFLIPAQTLSFNGVIIASDADLHSASAFLIDGSVIRLDIADDIPTEPPAAHRDKRVRLNSGASASTSYAPKRISVTLKLPAPFEAANRETTADETILQLKKWIRGTKGIPIGMIRIKDLSGKDLLDDAKTLLQCGIQDKSELAVELLLPSLSSVLSLRVILENGDERETVVVDATGKVYQLRAMLEGNQVGIINDVLPDPYFFLHRQEPLDENLSFVEQNIREGAIIEILPGLVAVYMTLKLETNIPHLKPFFYVHRIHSNDTIRQLKDKIRTIEGYPVHRILIRKNGIVQPDHKKLYECSITSDYGVTVEILD